MPKQLKYIWTNIKREKFLAVSNILVMSFTFLLLGLFIYVIAISQTALRSLEQQVQLSVFFKDDFTEENIFGLKQGLESDQRVSAVNYVSKEDAFKLFTELNKDEPILLESISPSILPASLEIKVHNLKDLSPIAEQLAQTDGVEEVRFFRDVVERFKYWSSVTYIVGFVLVTVMLIVSYSVILATIRATIHAKGVELEILKLVGANDNFVKNPLLIQGVIFGVFSAFIAGILLLAINLIVNFGGVFSSGFTFGFMPSVFISPIVFSVCLFFMMLLSGLALGYFGSKSAVNKYLKY